MQAKNIGTFLIILLLGVTHGQYFGRMRSSFNPLYSICRDPSCSCPCDDFEYFLTLIRALEERDCACPPINSGNGFNVEILITKLVNALIDITTQALTQTTCHCPNSSNSCTGATCTNNTNGGSQSGGGLLDIDLLNPNKKDNLLGLDVGQQHLVGVGLGGGGNDGSQSTNGNQYPNSNSGKDEEGLINLDLLNQKKKDNVAQLDIVKKPVLGIALGGGGVSPSMLGNDGATNPNNTSD